MDPIERAVSLIERATDSQQPRFDKGWGGQFPFEYPVYLANEAPPSYSVDSRHRDQWLRKAWREEPHLAGVLNSVILIDSNRGWSLTGGRNQVLRYMNILHDADGEGWRPFTRKVALSFWATDMGGMVEIGRATKNGPARAFYHLDSGRCRLTGDTKYPLEYFPSSGGIQKWQKGDYFRLPSMPSDDEAYRGLGYCAISRAIEITRILYAILVHDQEQLAARAPRGLLLLQNVSEAQWEDSLASRESKLDSMERKYYAGVQVLASLGAESIDAKLVALSQLPSGFDRKTFTDLCLYAYALCFGYDPSEFWPVMFGAIGRGNETFLQAQKGSGKGGMDFALALQEQLQDELPTTLSFEFERRDDEGDLLEVSVRRAKLDIITEAYNAGLKEGAPLITVDEARSLMVDAGIVPKEWTEAVEDVKVTDTAQEERMSKVQIQRAIQRFPTEQIVSVSWPDNKMRILYDPDRGYGEKGRRTYAVDGR